MKLAVLIPTFNRPRQLERTLSVFDSIRGHECFDLFSVYIRDNSDPNVAYQNQSNSLKYGFNYAKNHCNMGYAYSIKQLMINALENYILFVSDDDNIIVDSFILLLKEIDSSSYDGPILLKYIKANHSISRFALSSCGYMKYFRLRNYISLSYLSSAIYPKKFISRCFHESSNSFQHVIPIACCSNGTIFRVFREPVFRINSDSVSRWNHHKLLDDILGIVQLCYAYKKLNWSQLAILRLLLLCWIFYVAFKNQFLQAMQLPMRIQLMDASKN